ncbi:MAG: DUF2127 domain-containing protein [Rhizobiales bacterium]|nr:DUF2127 domain-containing protein [Hyphomicrobiales bacterium]
MNNANLAGGSTAIPEASIHRFFEFTLLLKLLHSVLEIAGAGLVAFLSPGTIVAIATFLVGGELVEEPNDAFASFLMHQATALATSSKTSAIFFLVSHGAIKLILVAAVMAGLPLAYPVFIAALSLLIGYQTYSLMVAYSWWMVVLAVFDVAVLFLTWHEYRTLMRLGGAKQLSSRRAQE